MPPHCDSIDGPVVKAAIRALDEGSVALVLPFVGGPPPAPMDRSEARIQEALGTRTFSGRSCLKAVRRFYLDERDRPLSSLSFGSPRGHYLNSQVRGPFALD